jgi:hypothetical protein
MAFVEFYGDFNGGPHESMEAALAQDTEYAKELRFRLMTEILSGNLP